MNRVIYASRGGNTEKLAGAIARGAGARAVPADQFQLSDTADILFVGASIYAGAIDGRLRDFLKDLQPSQVGSVAVFGTAAGPKSALPEIKSILEPKGIPVLEEAFQCRGSFLVANRGRPNDEDLKRAEAFARKLCGGQS